MPHLIWEDDNVSEDPISSAEPYITDLTSEDFPNIKKTLSGTYFQNMAGDPIIVWADTPDGGAMRYEWKKRAKGADFVPPIPRSPPPRESVICHPFSSSLDRIHAQKHSRPPCPRGSTPWGEHEIPRGNNEA